MRQEMNRRKAHHGRITWLATYNAEVAAKEAELGRKLSVEEADKILQAVKRKDGVSQYDVEEQFYES